MYVKFLVGVQCLESQEHTELTHNSNVFSKNCFEIVLHVTFAKRRLCETYHETILFMFNTVAMQAAERVWNRLKWSVVGIELF